MMHVASAFQYQGVHAKKIGLKHALRRLKRSKQDHGGTMSPVIAIATGGDMPATVPRLTAHCLLVCRISVSR